MRFVEIPFILNMKVFTIQTSTLGNL